MKPNIHPDYHEITVKMTNGKSFKTRSTYGKEGDVYQLDVDINTHPAWTGGTAALNEKAGRVADFNKRFGNISFAATGAKKNEEKPEEKPAE
jgi:large subunit ribosomal protein L31